MAPVVNVRRKISEMSVSCKWKEVLAEAVRQTVCHMLRMTSSLASQVNKYTHCRLITNCILFYIDTCVCIMGTPRKVARAVKARRKEFTLSCIPKKKKSSLSNANRRYNGKVFPVHTIKGYRGSIAPLFLNLCSRWWWVVNCMPRLLYAREEITVPVEKKAGWFLEKRRSVADPGIWAPDRAACS